MQLDSQVANQRAKAQKGGPHSPWLAAHLRKTCVRRVFASISTTMTRIDATQPIGDTRTETDTYKKSQIAKVCHPPGVRGENTDFQQGESLATVVTAESGSTPPRNTPAPGRGAETAGYSKSNVRFLRCVGCAGSNLTYCVRAGICARAHAAAVIVGLDPAHPTHPKKVIRYPPVSAGSGALSGGGVFPPHPEHWTPHPTHLGELTTNGGDLACPT